MTNIVIKKDDSIIKYWLDNIKRLKKEAIKLQKTVNTAKNIRFAYRSGKMKQEYNPKLIRYGLYSSGTFDTKEEYWEDCWKEFDSRISYLITYKTQYLSEICKEIMDNYKEILKIELSNTILI